MHLKKHGVKVLGYEYANAAIEFGHARGVDIRKLDLECDVLTIHHDADLVMSMEVAEHRLPAPLIVT